MTATQTAGRPRLVLASGSPRRRELLTALGVEFERRPADIDETPLSNENPAAYVLRLAREAAPSHAPGARSRPTPPWSSTASCSASLPTPQACDMLAPGRPRASSQRRRVYQPEPHREASGRDHTRSNGGHDRGRDRLVRRRSAHGQGRRLRHPGLRALFVEQSVRELHQRGGPAAAEMRRLFAESGNRSSFSKAGRSRRRPEPHSARGRRARRSRRSPPAGGMRDPETRA